MLDVGARPAATGRASYLAGARAPLSLRLPAAHAVHSIPRLAMDTRNIQLATAYGDVVASEQVSADQFPGALRRFHADALLRANSVVVVDGIIHTRNAFLEFVRHFNDVAEREARQAHA